MGYPLVFGFLYIFLASTPQSPWSDNLNVTSSFIATVFFSFYTFSLYYLIKIMAPIATHIWFSQKLISIIHILIWATDLIIKLPSQHFQLDVYACLKVIISSTLLLQTSNLILRYSPSPCWQMQTVICLRFTVNHPVALFVHSILR